MECRGVIHRPPVSLRENALQATAEFRSKDFQKISKEFKKTFKMPVDITTPEFVIEGIKFRAYRLYDMVFFSVYARNLKDDIYDWVQVSSLASLGKMIEQGMLE